MSKFKVGDRARVVVVRNNPSKKSRWAPGAIVTVAECRNGINERTGNTFEYIVQTDDHIATGEYALVMGWQLEPLTPDLGSWEEIARTIKWKPEGVTV